VARVQAVSSSSWAAAVEVGGGLEGLRDVECVDEDGAEVVVVVGSVRLRFLGLGSPLKESAFTIVTELQADMRKNRAERDRLEVC